MRWTAFESTIAHGTLWLVATSYQGPWFLALDHSGVVAELALPSADFAGPGLDRYAFPTLTALYDILPRIYQLSTSLPDAPLKIFVQQTAKLPKTTEAERLVVQRIGQDIFRASLMDYWQGRCPLNGITDPVLLHASHIVPWSECTDAQRIYIHSPQPAARSPCREVDNSSQVRKSRQKLCQRTSGSGSIFTCDFDLKVAN